MKNKLSMTSVLFCSAFILGMVNVSKAVSLNPDGMGQVLLYPYYTAREGNDTYVSVMNTADEAKSVRVRFLEGVNSRETLSFNLYLGAFDVWVAALTATENGDGVQLLIPDSSCTVPYYFGDDVIDPGENEADRLGRVEFTDAFFTGELDDPGPDDLERVQSGYIELIEMGTVVNDTQNSADAGTHVITNFPSRVLARPANCTQLVDAWNGGYWSDDANVDHEPPSGGLRGGATIINVEHGTMFTYKAEAIDGFSTEIMHFGPADGRPDLSSGNVTTSNVSIDGVLDTQTWPTSIEAVSAAILYDSIINEYVIDPLAGALSEWVITLPTKRFYTDAIAAIDVMPVAPFTVVFDGSMTRCEPFTPDLWDRETAPFAPQLLLPTNGEVEPDREFSLCYAANVIRITDGTSGNTLPMATQILGEPRFFTFFIDEQMFPNMETVPDGFLDPFDSGWLRFYFWNSTRSAVDTNSIDTGTLYRGLPAIGFWVNTYTNSTLSNGAVLANYGGTFRHSGSREIELLSETP